MPFLFLLNNLPAGTVQVGLRCDVGVPAVGRLQRLQGPCQGPTGWGSLGFHGRHDNHELVPSIFWPHTTGRAHIRLGALLGLGLL